MISDSRLAELAGLAAAHRSAHAAMVAARDEIPGEFINYDVMQTAAGGRWREACWTEDRARRELERSIDFGDAEIILELAEARASLAAVTAERDRLRAELDRVVPTGSGLWRVRATTTQGDPEVVDLGAVAPEDVPTDKFDAVAVHGGESGHA